MKPTRPLNAVLRGDFPEMFRTFMQTNIARFPRTTRAVRDPDVPVRYMAKSTEPAYEIVEHTADLGVRVRGRDMGDLFSNAALVLTDLLVSTAPSTESAQPMAVSVTGADSVDLLVRWLGEVLYLFEGESLVTVEVTIERLTPVHLEAIAWTLVFHPVRHERLYGIKAVTYHQANITEKSGTLEAFILLDV